MFDQSIRQKKQRNWKTVNLNLNEAHEQPQYNRSIIADNSKKYCPRKDSSQERIFAKSKERLHLSKHEAFDKHSSNFNTATKETNAKPYLAGSTYHILDSRLNLAANEGKNQNKYQQKPPVQNRTSIRNLISIHDEYQTGQNPNKNIKSSQMNNFGNAQILKQSKASNESSPDYEKIQFQINENTAIISDLKEQFETFKYSVLRQLQEEKEFLRQSILRLSDEFMLMRERIREEVYAEFEIKHKSMSVSFKQSRKNSTEIKLEDIFKMRDDSMEDIEVVQSKNVISIETFGKIQHNGSEVRDGLNGERRDIKVSEFQPRRNSLLIEQNQRDGSQKVDQQSLHESRRKQNNHDNAKVISSFGFQQTNKHFGTQTQISDAIQNKQVPTRELRTYKNSGNFPQTPMSNSQHNQPAASQASIPNEYVSQLQSVFSSRRCVDQTDQLQRFSQILKRQYEEQSKSSVHVSRLDKEKISERMNHVSKFQGAMQKLKTEIMEFKNLSDTKDIKKIKFSQNKPNEKYLKEIKLNEISLGHPNDSISKGF